MRIFKNACIAFCLPLVVAAGGCGSVGNPTLGSTVATQDVQDATFLVVAVSDASLTTATAFGVGPQLLGTNAHVAATIAATWAEPNGTALVFQHETGDVWLVTTVWWHPGYDGDSAAVTPDVGVLQVDANIPSFFTIAAANAYPMVEVFEAVRLCGFPGSVTLGVDFVGLTTGDFHPRATCLDGSVSAIQPFDPGQALTTANGQLIQHDISTKPGLSGSAVLNASGEIIGVHALGAAGSSEQNFAIRIDKLAELLAMISDGATGRALPPGAIEAFAGRR
jgi:V8-like Glu-specific endopeptidase